MCYLQICISNDKRAKVSGMHYNTYGLISGSLAHDRGQGSEQLSQFTGHF